MNNWNAHKIYFLNSLVGFIFQWRSVCEYVRFNWAFNIEKRYTQVQKRKWKIISLKFLSKCHEKTERREWIFGDEIMAGLLKLVGDYNWKFKHHANQKTFEILMAF